MLSSIFGPQADPEPASSAPATAPDASPAGSSESLQSELSPGKDAGRIAEPADKPPTLLDEGGIEFDKDSVVVTPEQFYESPEHSIDFEGDSVRLAEVPPLEWYKEPAEYTYKVNELVDHDEETLVERHEDVAVVGEEEEVGEEDNRGFLVRAWRFLMEMVYFGG